MNVQIGARANRESEGIDVSRHNCSPPKRPIDWTAVRAAGIEWAYARATLGAVGVDPTFAVNWAGAQAAGLAVGAYHLYITGLNPHSQSANFLKALNGDWGQLAPVLDVEPRDGEIILDKRPITEGIRIWLADVERETGKRPMIYTNNPAWSALTTLPDWAADYSAWLARYGPREPVLPEPWKSSGKPWTIWQYTAAGDVAGIDGRVDRNRFRPRLETGAAQQAATRI